MADLFQKRAPGDRLRMPAGLYNLIVDAVRDHLQRRQAGGASSNRVANALALFIKNGSGAALDQYAVVGIGAAMAAPGGGAAIYYGDAFFESAEPAPTSPFAILQDPAGADQFAPIRASGVSFVRVSISNAGHAYAAPSAGVYTHLVSQSSAGPATILWKEPGGTQLNGAINDSVTNLTVDSGAAFPDVPFVVTIDAEDLQVTTVQGTAALNGAIDDVQTSLEVDSSAAFPSATPFVVTIDTERLNVTGVAGTTWTVTRGFQGTTADQHGDTSVITALAKTYWTVARGHNSTTPAAHADDAGVAIKSGVVWALVRLDPQSSGGGAANIATINGDSTADQVFSVGTAGTDFTIADIGAGMLQWNLPDAGPSARGVVSTGAQTIAGAKRLDAGYVYLGDPAASSQGSFGQSYGADLSAVWVTNISTSVTTKYPTQAVVELRAPQDLTGDPSDSPMLILRGSITIGGISVWSTEPCFAVWNNIAGVPLRGLWGTDAAGNTISGGLVTGIGTAATASIDGGTW